MLERLGAGTLREDVWHLSIVAPVRRMYSTCLGDFRLLREKYRLVIGDKTPSREVCVSGVCARRVAARAPARRVAARAPARHAPGGAAFMLRCVGNDSCTAESLAGPNDVGKRVHRP